MNPLTMSQATNSLPEQAGSSFPAENPAQATASLPEQAGSTVPARDYYCFDPGTKAGILTPTGEYLLHGFHKKTGKPVKKFDMENARAAFRNLPPGKIRTEYARLANGKGITRQWIEEIESMGFEVWVCNTRDAWKGATEFCASNHRTKVDGCDDCTKRDLDAMTNAARKFYRPRFDKQSVGTKVTTGTPAAIQNTRLNAARFEFPVPYESVSKKMPSWLLEKFPGDITAAATLYITAQVAAELGFGVRMFRRLLGNHQHARRCQSYSNMQYHYGKAGGDLKIWNAAAKQIFKELRAQAKSSLPEQAGSRLPARATSSGVVA